MGKKGAAATQQVTDYRMSIMYGICHGTVDRLIRILINERVAWLSKLETQGEITLSDPNFFGGALKEGGIEGRVYYQPGTYTQLLAPEVSEKVHQAEPEESPGYRGIATATFLTIPNGSRGFKWGTNNPYIPPSWFTVTRIDRGWRPEIAAIGEGAVREYTFAESTVNVAGVMSRVDWEAGYAYFLHESTAFEFSVYKYKLPTLELVDTATRVEMTEPDVNSLGLQLSVGPDAIYLEGRISGNFFYRIIRVDKDTLLETHRSTGSITTYFPTATRFQPKSFIVVRAASGKPFVLVNTEMNTDQRKLVLFDGDTMELVAGLWSPAHNFFSGLVASPGTTGVAFALNYDWLPNVPNEIKIYKVALTGSERYVGGVGTVNFSGFNVVGSFRPEDLDPAYEGTDARFYVFAVKVVYYDSLNPGLVMGLEVRTGAGTDTDWYARWEEDVGIVWAYRMSDLVPGESLIMIPGRVGDEFYALGSVSRDIYYIFDSVTGTLKQQIEVAEVNYNPFTINANSLTGQIVSHSINQSVDLITIDPAYTGTDMNPAHIIRECLTNRVWGMGAPASAIDDDYFGYAANVLYDEDFGLSMIWTAQDTIENFVREVIDHIEAALYVDPSTGKFRLKLIRDDYDPDALPIFDESNCVIESFQTRSPAEIINEIVVTWTNPENEQEETYTLQDLGGIVINGGEITSDNRNYYGVRNAPLAAKLAARDLSAATAPVTTAEITTNRKGWHHTPGDVIKLSSEEHEAYQLIMRIAKIDYGSPKQPEIKVSLTQDIFSFEKPVIETPPSTEHVILGEVPLPADYTLVTTLNYFFSGEVDQARLTEYPDVFMGLLVSTAQNDAYAYDLYGEVTDAVGNTSMQLIGTRDFIRRDVLPEDWNAEAVTTPSLGTATVGGFALVGPDGSTEAEMELVAFQDSDTVLRGILDTVPRAWPAGTPVRFFSPGDVIEDRVIRSALETVSYKVLPVTSLGGLSFSAAPLIEHVATERPWLPTRPAGVTINEVAWAPQDVSGLLTIPVEWANRNRVTEDSQVLAWDALSVTPEDGQTTRIRVRDFHTGVEVASIPVAEGETSHDLEPADFGASTAAIVRVTAERDGFESLQGYEQVLLTALLDPADVPAGVWYDTNLHLSFWQDEEGTVPIHDGAPVGRIDNQRETIL